MDLRAEPLVLTVPVIQKDRYFSIQLIDAYTFNFAYIGSRATGNDGGVYLIAGPNWKGETPKGVTKVIRSETEFVFALYRTQLFNPSDIDNVKKVQAGYKAQTLSAFLGVPAPKAAPAIDFIKPLTPEAEKTSPQFYGILNFTLQFCPTDPSETQLMARFAKIGVGGGKTFDASKLSPEMAKAIESGITDAWAEFGSLRNQVELGKVTAGDVFGTREYLKNNYLYRMAGAVRLSSGNSKLEAMYPVYAIDEAKQPLNGVHRYTLRFAPGQLPPVNAFWSLTMYELPTSLLVANPINRYLINSPMLPQLKRDADGGLTLFIQNESPRQGQGSQLAASTEGTNDHVSALILAQSRGGRRQVDCTADEAGGLNKSEWTRLSTLQPGRRKADGRRRGRTGGIASHPLNLPVNFRPNGGFGEENRSLTGHRTVRALKSPSRSGHSFQPNNHRNGAVMRTALSSYAVLRESSWPPR